MISNNDMLFNQIEKVWGCPYEGMRGNGMNCARVDNPGNYGFAQPQGFCGFSRNDYYSPAVQCYTPQRSQSFYEGNMYNLGTNPCNFRIRFEKIEELIK